MSSLDKIDRDLAITEIEREAAIAFAGGTHAGGARPKLTVRDKDAIWIVKLNRHDDRWNYVRVEAAMLDLASKCQIRVPAHRVEMVAHQDVLLVQRFDRTITDTGIMKHRVASAQSVFQADEEYARANFSGSYMRLSSELARWGLEVTADRRELYRRMAFNCLTGITDDHERNHSLVAVGNHFRLADAYDLSPSRPTTRAKRQAMAIGGEGDLATRANLLSAVARFDLSIPQAETIIDEVKVIVAKQWRECFSQQQVPEKDIDLLTPCFDHDYFEGCGPSTNVRASEFAIEPTEAKPPT